ncbi:MAG TPA: hypothetical protein VL240_13040 [Candidatus Binatia bacterium]|nr:hypothetical protein [Candidatus Binatia bacterium]
MSHKDIAIVAAMRLELSPLIGKLPSQQVSGVELFELPGALVAMGGIGEKCARRAAEVAIGHVQPKLLLSAGMVGAVSSRLKVGDVGRIREVVDAATGARYAASGGGVWVLATAQDVSDAKEKHELLTKFGVDVVDMEAAAVAQAAQEHGLEFAGLKAVCDDSAFTMPPLNRFITKHGRFSTRKFLMYMALHPGWWGAVGKLRGNSNIAAANLCRALQHLIESGCQAPVASYGSSPGK